jgi:hypothetical protein
MSTRPALLSELGVDAADSHYSDVRGRGQQRQQLPQGEHVAQHVDLPSVLLYRHVLVAQDPDVEYSRGAHVPERTHSLGRAAAYRASVQFLH